MFLEKFILSSDGPIQGQKQDRDDNTQGDFSTMEQWLKRKSRKLPCFVYSRKRR